MPSVVDAIDWATTPDGLDQIAADLRAMRTTAGDPSYATLVRRIAARRAARGVPAHEQRMARSTLYDCFRDGRRRLDSDAVAEIATVLGLPEADRTRWALRVRAAQAAADGAAIAVAQDQAPDPVPYFAGQRAALAELRSALTDPAGMVWVTGMPGSGKTQLALMVAQQLSASGVANLFLDLRGHAESPPVGAGAAQQAVLRQLGHPDTGPENRRGERLGGVLRDSGRLLVLDDAADGDQVAAVLGGAVAGRVLVTSRAQPPPDPRWTQVELTGMDANDTAAVLRRLAARPAGRGTGEPATGLGKSDRGQPAPARGESASAPGESERAEAGPSDAATAPGESGQEEVDPEAVTRLAEISGGLPLAIALVGGRLATHPEWTLAEHVELLADRVHAAQLDDELRSTLELSYIDLSVDAAQLLRAMADLPVAELGPDLAAAAAQTSTEVARRSLAELVSGGLAVRRGADRIALHSLVRAFGQALARDTDSPRARREAFGRVAQHAAEQVWRAYDTIARSMDDSPRRSPFEYPRGGWTGDEAGRWLQQHLPALLALAHTATERGHPDLLFRLSEGLSWWMNMAGHHEDALRLHEAAADVAAEREDADAVAMASLDAGQLLTHRNSPEEALAHFRRAGRLVTGTELSDPGVAGLLLNMSALVEMRLGRLTEAEQALRAAVLIHQRLGEDIRLMSALVNLGIVLYTAGEFDAERQVLESALALAEDHDHPMFLGQVLVNRAYLHLTTGDLDSAWADAERGVQVATQLGSPYLALSGDGTAAEILRRRGDLTAAEQRVTTSLAAARRLGSGVTTAEQLLVAAAIARDQDRLDQALELVQEAESLLQASGDQVVRGRIWQLRGELTDDAEARQHWLRSALAQFESVGAFQARELRAAMTPSRP